MPLLPITRPCTGSWGGGQGGGGGGWGLPLAWWRGAAPAKNNSAGKGTGAHRPQEGRGTKSAVALITCQGILTFQIAIMRGEGRFGGSLRTRHVAFRWQMRGEFCLKLPVVGGGRRCQDESPHPPGPGLGR
jgi:hypothetical protein